MADRHAEQQKKPTAQRQNARPSRTPSVSGPQRGPVSVRQLIQRALDDPGSLTAVDGAHLQRSIGNRAVGQILAASAAKRAANPGAPAIQTKLTLGPAGDKYEQEADRTAKQVMRSLDAPAPDAKSDAAPNETLAARPFDTSLAALQANGMARVAREYSASLAQRGQSAEGTLQAKPLADSISRIQRAEMEEDELQMKPKADGINRIQRADMEDEDELQAKPLADGVSRVQRADMEDEEELQAKPLHGLEGGEVDPGVAATIGSAKGGGAPLHDSVRSSMEQGFGADFSGVRVHTGGQADALNRSLNARAFTSGRDLFFRQGEYNPGSRAGQELIAHELTHTVQQGAVTNSPNRIQTKPTIGLARDRFTVQRGFFDKLKESKLNKKYQSLKQKITGKTEEKKIESEESGNVLKASIALKIGTEVRSEGNRKENGHAWIELEPVAGWPKIEETGLPNKMSEATKEGLAKHQWHTIGFYPGGEKRSSVFSIPGEIQEPERPSMTQSTTASKSFELNKTQAEKLLDYVNDKRDAKYNFMRYNCTSFAVGALGAAGFTANEFLGRVTSKRIESPNKVYKRLFERAALGDKSVKIAKTLGQKEKHISDPEENALKVARGAEGDLLNNTEDVEYASQSAKSLSFTIRGMLKVNPQLKTKDLTGWHWMMNEFTAHDKRTLEAAYPTVFDQKIDDVLKPKTQEAPTFEETELTSFFDEPNEEKEEKKEDNFGDGDEYTNFFEDN